MSGPDAVVFSLTDEAPRTRWLTRETLSRVVVEVLQGDGLDLLLFGDTSANGQPHSFPNVSAPFTQSLDPRALFAGLAYTLVRRPGSAGPLLVRISAHRQ
jgi:hypothetical protein